MSKTNPIILSDIETTSEQAMIQNTITSDDSVTPRSIIAGKFFLKNIYLL